MHVSFVHVVICFYFKFSCIIFLNISQLFVFCSDWHFPFFSTFEIFLDILIYVKKSVHNYFNYLFILLFQPYYLLIRTFFFTFIFTINCKNCDAHFTCKYGLYQKEWLILFSFYIFATVMTFRFLFLYIGDYILTNLISVVWPIIFSWNYSSYPLFSQTMESMCTPQAILFGKMLGGFVTMFLKDQVFFLFLHIPLYSLFVFLYSKLPYLSRILDTSTDSS